MKDLRYLLLLIGFVVIAHATKKANEGKNQARLLPDIPDYKEQKRTDSGRIEASSYQIIAPAFYHFNNY
jgi:hypothetical protein